MGATVPTSCREPPYTQNPAAEERQMPIGYGGHSPNQLQGDPLYTGSSYRRETGNGNLLMGYPVPDELLLCILGHLPDICLIQVVPLVCRQWQALSQTWHFWKKRLAAKAVAVSLKRLEMFSAAWEDDSDVRAAVQWLCTEGHCIINQNLIKNPSGQEKLKYWEVQNGGDGLEVEEIPVGCDPLPPEAGLPSHHCFVSSYSICKRSQVISLHSDAKIPSFALMVLQPDLVISEWVSARFDCGAMSQTDVYVKGTGGKAKLFQMHWKDSDYGRVEWHKMLLRVPFKNLPAGIVTLRFRNLSRDTQFWAGHYGAKTAGSSLVLDVSQDFQPMIAEPSSAPEGMGQSSLI